MDVGVADEACAPSVEELRDAGQPPVQLDEPRVAREVDPLPVLAQVALGPVGRAPDRLVRGLEQRERLAEAVRCRVAHDHAAHGRRWCRADGCGRPYC